MGIHRQASKQEFTHLNYQHDGPDQTRPGLESQNPPANPLNFKLTHMLGCLRTIIIITGPMMRFVLRSFPVSLAFCFAVYQIVNGHQGRAEDWPAT